MLPGCYGEGYHRISSVRHTRISSVSPDAVVVHVGSNYIKIGKSKLMFVELIDTLKGSSYVLIKDYCHFVGITFIDNFNTFWKQKMLYSSSHQPVYCDQMVALQGIPSLSTNTSVKNPMTKPCVPIFSVFALIGVR